MCIPSAPGFSFRFVILVFPVRVFHHIMDLVLEKDSVVIIFIVVDVITWLVFFFFVKSLCNALRQVRPTRSCSMRKKNTKICKKKTAFYRQLEEGGECCLSTLLICFYSPTHSFRRVRNNVHPYNDVFASGPRE